MRKYFLSNSEGIFKLFTSLLSNQGLGNTMALIFFLMVAQGYAQRTAGDMVGSNELKLNALYLPGGYPELSYERILGNKSAVGISVGFFMGSPDSNYATDMLIFDKAILPYYRYYFGQRRASGFFLEGNTLIYSEKSNLQDSRETGLGMGLAVGMKVLVKNNWHIDLLAGGGVGINSRDSDSDFLNIPDMYPRLGIAIGKRF